MRQLDYGWESRWFALFLGGVEQVSTGAWWFKVPVFILSDGVLSALGGAPALISHSEAMGVAVGTLILRGICVLMRRFSVPMSYLIFRRREVDARRVVTLGEMTTITPVQA